jgi:hypothetical protein
MARKRTDKNNVIEILILPETDVLPVRLNYLNSPQLDISPEPQKYRKTNNDDDVSKEICRSVECASYLITTFSFLAIF